MDPASVTTNNQTATDTSQPVVPAPVVQPPTDNLQQTMESMPVVAPEPVVETLQSTVSVTPPAPTVQPTTDNPQQTTPSGEDLQQLTQQLMKDLQNMQTPGQQPQPVADQPMAETTNTQQTTEPQAVPAAPVVEASQPVAVPDVQPLTDNLQQTTVEVKSAVEPVVVEPPVVVAPVFEQPRPAADQPMAETANTQQTTSEAVSVTENKVTVYTTTNCPFCKAEKEYLFSKGLKYDEKNVETDEVALKDMLAMSDNFAGVPVTLLQNSKGEKLVVKGFTKDEFEQELVKLGMLAAPTAPVGAPSAPSAA